MNKKRVAKLNLATLFNKLLMEKKCLECESPLVGRVDKKFCSDYCRNSYNNKINTNNNFFTINIF